MFWYSIIGWLKNEFVLILSDFYDTTEQGFQLLACLLDHPKFVLNLVTHYHCQTPLQLTNQTQLQLVGVGVDFVFPCHKKKEEGRKGRTPTQLLSEGMTLHVSNLIAILWVSLQIVYRLCEEFTKWEVIWARIDIGGYVAKLSLSPSSAGLR